MQTQFILGATIEAAMAQAEYDKLEERSFSGQIPPCAGVIAFGETLRDCENELRSALEDWILLGLKLKHQLPEVCALDSCSARPHREIDADLWNSL